MVFVDLASQTTVLPYVLISMNLNEIDWGAQVEPNDNAGNGAELTLTLVKKGQFN